MNEPTYYLPVIDYSGEHYVAETKIDPARGFNEILQDVWDGQLEGIARLWRIEHSCGQFFDETPRLAEALGAMSFDKCERPYPALRTFIGNHFVDFYDDDSEAYQVAMRREHGTLNRAQQL